MAGRDGRLRGSRLRRQGPHMIKILPSIERLQECFLYFPATGELFWKTRPREHFATHQGWMTCNSEFAGKLAGSLKQEGYRVVRLFGTIYQAHRVVWKLMTGVEPPKSIDHIDMDLDNNRWENLRAATGTEQKWNMRVRKDSLTGSRGVSLVCGRWRVQIVVEGKRQHLGYFGSREEAIAAYDVAARSTHGEFYRSPL